MKLNPQIIERFEKDQLEYGTQTAIFNLLYLKATGELHDLGVQKVKTTMKAER